MPQFLWDQHTCLPLQVGADVDPLTRYERRGGTFVSVNAGYSPHSFADMSVTGLAGPVWSQNVRFEWLHRDSPGRLCQV